jgi:hypothetical protein
MQKYAGTGGFDLNNACRKWGYNSLPPCLSGAGSGFAFSSQEGLPAISSCWSWLGGGGRRPLVVGHSFRQNVFRLSSNYQN